VLWFWGILKLCIDYSYFLTYCYSHYWLSLELRTMFSKKDKRLFYYSDITIYVSATAQKTNAFGENASYRNNQIFEHLQHFQKRSERISEKSETACLRKLWTENNSIYRQACRWPRFYSWEAAKKHSDGKGFSIIIS